MSFGLKNAEATYQRLMKKLFYRMLGKMVEVYIDGILVKKQEMGGSLCKLAARFWPATIL